MDRVYASLILAGRKTIDDVPQKLRMAVERILEQESNI